MIFPNISWSLTLFPPRVFRKIYLSKQTFHTITNKAFTANISQFQNRAVAERDTSFSKITRRLGGGGAFHEVVKKWGALSSPHVRLHSNMPAVIHGEIHTFNKPLFTKETTRSTLSTRYKRTYSKAISYFYSLTLYLHAWCLFLREQDVFPLLFWGDVGAGGRNEEICHPVLPEPHVAIFPPYNI